MMVLQIQLSVALFLFFISSIFAFPIPGNEGLLKRDLATVADAVRAVAAHECHLLGQGSRGNGYALQDTFHGENAVIKVINKKGPGITLGAVEEEVRNLRVVEQFIAWGQNAKYYYIVMKNMGDSGPHTGLPEDQLARLTQEAHERYLRQYAMVHTDRNPENVAFRKHNGVWVAEIIDWGIAQLQAPEVKGVYSHSRQVHESQLPAKENVPNSASGGAKPKCDIL